MKKIELLSPAKLNLFLHITGRRDNGYHDLQSLFHFIDYGDDMTFQLTDTASIELTCNIKELETEDNLIVKAAKALQDYRSNKSHGIVIDVTKRLPMGGGVGGGSSNAATTLIALNELWSLNLTSAELETIGNKLGADVPIFVRGMTSIAEGTGDVLFDHPIKEQWYLVITPDAHVNTALLFNNPDLPRNTPKLKIENINYTDLTDDHKNDFQQLVINQYPNVAKALNWLLEYAPARMTGTGACVFSVFKTETQAQKVLEKLPVELTGFVAKGCNVSPAHRQLVEQFSH